MIYAPTNRCSIDSIRRHDDRLTCVGGGGGEGSRCVCSSRRRRVESEPHAGPERVSAGRTAENRKSSRLKYDVDEGRTNKTFKMTFKTSKKLSSENRRRVCRETTLPATTGSVAATRRLQTVVLYAIYLLLHTETTVTIILSRLVRDREIMKTID